MNLRPALIRVFTLRQSSGYAGRINFNASRVLALGIKDPRVWKYSLAKLIDIYLRNSSREFKYENIEKKIFFLMFSHPSKIQRTILGPLRGVNAHFRRTYNTLIVRLALKHYYVRYVKRCYLIRAHHHLYVALT